MAVKLQPFATDILSASEEGGKDGTFAVDAQEQARKADVSKKGFN